MLTIYDDADNVPVLCSRSLESDSYSGQIGEFPICGKAAEFMLTFDFRPVYADAYDKVYSGLCNTHTAEVRSLEVFQAVLVKVETFPERDAPCPSPQ